MPEISTWAAAKTRKLGCRAGARSERVLAVRRPSGQAATPCPPVSRARARRRCSCSYRPRFRRPGGGAVAVRTAAPSSRCSVSPPHGMRSRGQARERSAVTPRPPNSRALRERFAGAALRRRPRASRRPGARTAGRPRRARQTPVHVHRGFAGAAPALYHRQPDPGGWGSWTEYFESRRDAGMGDLEHGARGRIHGQGESGGSPQIGSAFSSIPKKLRKNTQFCGNAPGNS